MVHECKPRMPSHEPNAALCVPVTVLTFMGHPKKEPGMVTAALSCL